MTDERDLIALGIIRKAHGVRGEASVELFSDDLDRMDDVDAVVLVSPDEKTRREAVVENVRVHSGRLLVKFEGIDSPEALGELRNWTVEVDEEEARQLDEDEYYLHDLAGLALVDREGRTRGVVKEAYEGGAGILLEVEHEGRTYDVPFAADICVEINLNEKRILVDLPEGIDSLDAVEDERQK